MRIEYICHACLLVDTGNLKIVTDPWFQGSAYCGQWHVFPKPVNADLVQQADVVLLSHGHEDHFHEPSLRALPKKAKVFYPYSWYGGAKPFLEQLGFATVVEAPPHRTYQLSSDTSMTYLVNGMDSVIVIESKGEVFVNVNDALHSYPPKIIDMFVRSIRAKWPRINTVFCGFGGASYFPNTLHCDGKNDIEIGGAREQLFAHNFCRIVHDLRPEVAVPFAADFALLSPGQNWINDLRFPRSRMSAYFHELYPGESDLSVIHDMYSGDSLVSNKLVASSPYRQELRDGCLNHLIEQQYLQETKEVTSPARISEADADILEKEMRENLRLRTHLFDDATLEKIQFTVKVTDLCEKAYFNIDMSHGEPRLQRSDKRSTSSILQIDASSRILRYSFASDWGGDAITIGYGCEIYVFDSETINASLDTACVRLVTKQPVASRHWRVEPLRVARHLLTSPTTRTWVARAALSRSSAYSPNKTNDIMRELLFRTKCEVCRACDLPLLDEKFAARL